MEGPTTSSTVTATVQQDSSSLRTGSSGRDLEQRAQNLASQYETQLRNKTYRYGLRDKEIFRQTLEDLSPSARTNLIQQLSPFGFVDGRGQLNEKAVASFIRELESLKSGGAVPVNCAEKMAALTKAVEVSKRHYQSQFGSDVDLTARSKYVNAKTVSDAELQWYRSRPGAVPVSYTRGLETPINIGIDRANMVLRRGETMLTFDDGPYPITNRILDILKQSGQKATFFVCGNNIKGNEKILQRMVAEGHAIGVHTMTHPDDLTELSTSQVQQELGDTKRLIEQAVPGYTVRTFRPPHGHTDGRVNSIANSLGLSLVQWSAQLNDVGGFSGQNGEPAKPTSIAKRQRIIARDADRGIILAHDKGANTASKLDQILAPLNDNNIRTVTADFAIQRYERNRMLIARRNTGTSKTS